MIQNSSGSPVYIQFKGPVNRDLLLQAGKNTIPLPFGRYEYQYTACGIKYSGKIIHPLYKVMRIPRCKTTKLIIKNYTLTEAPGTGLTLRLTGPANYYFVITKPMEKITIQQGTYKFVLRGCGQEIQSGEIKFDMAQYRWSIHCPP